MKAYFVWIGEEWGDWVHGKTANEAKKMFWKHWSDIAENWTEMRPIRNPKLDNIPITRENLFALFTPEEIEEWDIKIRDFICTCEICEMYK